MFLSLSPTLNPAAKSCTPENREVVNEQCERCGGRIVEIDHYGERLTGCPNCNRWQASTGEWCRLAPDDIIALRAITKSDSDLHS